MCSSDTDGAERAKHPARARNSDDRHGIAQRSSCREACGVSAVLMVLGIWRSGSEQMHGDGDPTGPCCPGVVRRLRWLAAGVCLAILLTMFASLAVLCVPGVVPTLARFFDLYIFQLTLHAMVFMVVAIATRALLLRVMALGGMSERWESVVVWVDLICVLPACTTLWCWGLLRDVVAGWPQCIMLRGRLGPVCWPACLCSDRAVCILSLGAQVAVTLAAAAWTVRVWTKACGKSGRVKKLLVGLLSLLTFVSTAYFLASGATSLKVMLGGR